MVPELRFRSFIPPKHPKKTPQVEPVNTCGYSRVLNLPCVCCCSGFCCMLSPPMSRQPWGSPSADRVDQVALTSRLCFQLLVLVRGGLGGRGGRGGGKMFCRLRFLSWPLFLGYSLLRSWCYAVEVLLYALWRSWCYAVEFFCTLYDAFNATLQKFFCTLSNALDATP